MTIESLTAAERIDLDRVLLNAAVVGWLKADQQLLVTPAAKEILVHSTGVGTQRQRAYARTQRWIFELLYDLAHGYWSGPEQEEIVAAGPAPAHDARLACAGQCDA